MALIKRLSKFLLRHGRRFTGTKKAWSKAHDVWLRAQRWPLAALDQTHAAYLRTVDEAIARLRHVEDDLRGLLELEPLRPRVQRLRCFRGIDTLSAAGLCAEVGDFRRFPRPNLLSGFLGIVPSERTSDLKRRQGSISLPARSFGALWRAASERYVTYRWRCAADY